LLRWEDCEGKEIEGMGAVSYETLVQQFGKTVADLVVELTNDEKKLEAMGKVAYMVGKLKGLSASALLVKLCDTLNNSSDQPSENQARKYDEIIRRVMSDTPAVWTDKPQQLAERILAALATKLG
jgi:(p)ppGpp synthase/HD superfamily hydrolase